MATVDVTDASSPSPLGSPPRGRKRPRSLLRAMSAPRAAVALVIHGHKAAAVKRCAAQREDDRQQAQKPRPQALLPGLPDHLAQLCLSRLPPRLLYSVCRPWRRLLYSPSTPPFPALYALLSTPSTVGRVTLEFQSFDPVSSKWLPLPSPQPQPTVLLRHPAYMSRHFPVQSVAAGHSLVLVAATAGGQEGPFVPALNRPLVFHAPTGSWRHGPPFRPAPRRWCAAGAMQGKVYVASGVTGPDYDAGVARAVHRWDVSSSWSSSAGAGPGIRGGSGGSWEEVAPLKDARFSRDAVEAVAARGKLYMVNARGGWAREGAAYDPATDRWEDMPPGMLMGWTGPAASSPCSDEEGSRRRTSRCADETIYCVEAADGVLWAYEWGKDKWVAVLASDRLKGVMQLTAGGRVGSTTDKQMMNQKQNLCAVLAGGAGVAVIDVGARRIWEVLPPEGRVVVGVHMLPRMSRPEALVDEEEEEDDDEAEERRRIAAAHLADRLPRPDESH